MSGRTRDTIRQGGARFVMIEHDVLDQAQLKPITFAVYCSLMMYANEDGYCFPSKRVLAGRAGIGITSVSKAIDELESLGLLERNNRLDPMTGEMISNEYVVYRPSDVDLRSPDLKPDPQPRGDGGQPRDGDPQPRGGVPPSREAMGPQSRDGELNKNQLTRPNSELEDSASSRGDERIAPDHVEERAEETEPGPAKEQPFQMLERVMEIQGVGMEVWTRQQLGRQLSVAKRLIGDGVTIAEVESCCRWIVGQQWASSVDMFLIEKKLGDHRIATQRKSNQHPGTTRRGMSAEQALGKYYRKESK